MGTANRTGGDNTVGASNRLTSDGTFTYAYDAEGNRTSRTRISDDPADDYTTQYAWDYRNRLTGVTSKNNAGSATKTVAYAYDAFDRLVGKRVSKPGQADHQTAFVYDGDQIVLEFASPLPPAGEGQGEGGSNPLTASDLAHRYLWGAAVDQLLAIESPLPLGAGQGEGFDLSQPGNVIWPLANHEGTIRDLATFDAQTGTTTIANHRLFDSFGNLTSQTNAAVGCAFAYTGRLFDADSGLQYNHYRWYDPAVGRWLSVDPLGFAAGDTNLYRYVHNSPLNHTDPSGLCEPPTGFQPSGSGTSWGSTTELPPIDKRLPPVQFPPWVWMDNPVTGKGGPGIRFRFGGPRGHGEGGVNLLPPSIIKTPNGPISVPNWVPGIGGDRYGVGGGGVGGYFIFTW